VPLLKIWSLADPPWILMHLHTDHLGSVRLVTNVVGEILNTHDYFPFGEEIAPTPDYTTHKFTGHERDAEIGLDYMLARYYSTGLARFLSIDRVGGNPRGPQTWNRYSYASNNPITRFDPDGLTDIHIDVQRTSQNNTATMGTFQVRGTNISGATLERPDNSNQRDTSRIPAGTYAAARGRGATLGDVVWVNNVPNRTDIAIHAGNTADDTNGCIVVGTTAGDNRVNQIRNALNSLISQDRKSVV
jgi:RHS repeat-associated protein